ncbi:bacteriocin immunity protein [uncultured Lactobacillus sp.]|uniref:bacteriocin immunity protein n=1 Tax=uncultured Lactobacillus sp. TaxID=153152 RepID=UPI00262A39E9|nr:bacteriocin immunity protein [uncultured Lactobacillus sp.]
MIISSSAKQLNSKLSSQELQARQNAYLFTQLVRLYHSFEGRPGHEYSKLQDAIACVLDKINQNDHPYAYTNKLVMLIEARHALRGLYLSPDQNELLIDLREATKRTNLNYLYLSAIEDLSQFR